MATREVDAISNELLIELKKCSQDNNGITDELLSSLNCVFQSCLQPALDLVDRNNVTLVQCPSRRELFQVRF